MSKKFGIVELITAIGDDNVQIQPLDGCITDMKMKKDHSLFTFGSSMPFSLDGTEEMGIVVWMPRAKVKEFLGI